MTHTWLFLLFVAVAASQAPASRRPNFTGTWKVNFQKSKLAIPAPRSTTFTVEHNDPDFHLSRTHVYQGRSDTWSIRLTTNGKEVVRQEGDREIHSRMYWQGKELVFDTKILTGTTEATNFVKYRLSKDGRTLTAFERFRGPARQYDNVWVCEKQ